MKRHHIINRDREIKLDWIRSKSLKPKRKLRRSFYQHLKKIG